MSRIPRPSRALSLTVLAALASVSGADERIIYGEDDRRDVYETTDARMKQLARSTAVLVERTAVARDVTTGGGLAGPIAAEVMRAVIER